MKIGFKDIRRAALKRTSGVGQFGVDVEGFDRLSDPVVVLSAKCYRKIDAWEFRPWIQDFIDHLDTHWKGKNVAHFVLAVTVAANDDDMNDAARELARFLDKRGIEFHLWDAVFLTELLCEEPRLVDRYFNRYWTEAISAEVASDSPSVNPTSAVSPNNLGGSIAAMAALLQDAIVGPLNSSVSRELEAAIAELRRGRRTAIRNWVSSNRANDTAWATIEPAVRAKGLRALAMVELAQGDLEGSSALVAEANSLSGEEDPTARVMLTRVGRGVKAAIEELGTPTSRRQRELAAGLLIDADDVRGALEILSPLIGDDVSSEVLRLRAIATLLSGKGAASALNLVNSALSKEPEGAIAHLTRGIIRIASALVGGVHPGFSGPPNPISRALVRSEQTAFEQLDLARVEFDALLAIVDGDLRQEVEVWKLAALALHPSKRQEARAYGRYLLSRPVPDASVVAWCLQHGLPMRRGRLKKVIGDAIRDGRGTPGHVVVLALLAAKIDLPSRAIAVFQKFKDHFPEADTFFTEWRKQFGEDAGPPEASYSAAVRHAIDTKDNAPLVAFLSSGLSNPESLIAGSEFLTSRKAYAEVFLLREKLSAIGTVRAVELAAVAAFKSEEARGAIDILTNAARAGLSLPARLVQLRLRAQEIIGDHLNLIEDLKALLRQSDDPDLRGQLFNAYVRIGALEEATQVTKEAIEAGTLDDANALRAANVLRNFAPDTARRAIADIQRDQLPKALLPSLLSLSSELGLAAVQDEMIRKIFSDPEVSTGVTRFDSVEAVVEFMNKQADQYRSTIEQWLAGAIPAALALRGDSKDYALLFLGDRKSRRANIGLKFPMMLTAGTYRSTTALDTGMRPGLRLDLSALLLSDRAGILEKVEQAFDIHVPPSLPEALVEMEGKFRTVSAEIASQLRAIARRESAVQVVVAAKEGARELQLLEHAPEDDPGRNLFLSILENAFQSGHITRAEMRKAKEDLSYPEQDTGSELSFDSVIVGPTALLDLIRLGLLEPLARSFNVLVLEGDLDWHIEQIDLAEAEGIIGERLSKLRKTVAARLASSAWHTLPSRQAEFSAMEMQAPAHVRCLLETLPRREDDDPSLFWVEDRTLSRNPPLNAANLGQILASLKQSGQLSEAKYVMAMKNLRDAGYSFLPIDADELFAQINAAPIVSGQIIENDDLASIRSWFAQDAINLQYIDLTVEIDPSGTVLGESRRTLQLTHVVQDLFARIWSDPDASSEQMAARSTWVWTNLRLDRTPAAEGPENPQVRRQFAALNLAQALALPLHAELGSPEIPKSARAGYLDWLVPSAIEPLADADQEALEIVLDTVAGMLGRLLEPSDEPDEKLRRALDTHMRRVVVEYLRLLPLEWADRIASRKAVKDVLERHTVMLLEIGGEQAPVDSIAKAFAEAFASPSKGARFNYYMSGKSALLSLQDGADGVPTVTIKRGRHSFSMDPVTIALLHPDRAVRERVLLPLEDIGSVNKRMSQEERIAVASDPSPEHRIEIVHGFYARDFFRRLGQLDIRIRNSGQLRLDDFELPDPTVLLNYLGVADDFGGGGIELTTLAFRTLLERLGPAETAWRVSSIPMRLPDEILSDFIAAVEAQPANPRRFFSYALARAFARTRTGSLQEGDLEFLLNTDDERLRFFRTVLRHGARQALKSPQWLETNPELAFCLLWVHADQLVRVLDPGHSSLAQLTGWLSARTPRKFSDDEGHWGKWVQRGIFSLSANRIRGVIVAEAIELGAMIPAGLTEMIGRPVGDEWMPNPELLATVPPGAPAGCWLNRDPVPSFEKAGWMVENNAFLTREPSGLLQRMMGEVQEGNWRALVALVALLVDLDEIGPSELSELKKRVERCLALDDAFDPDPSRAALLNVAADIYGHQKDREAFKALVTVVVRLAKSKWPRASARLYGDREVDNLSIELANAVHLFSQAFHQGITARVVCFCEILKEISDLWLGFGDVAIELMENIVNQVDVPSAARIWPFLFELRASR